MRPDLLEAQACVDWAESKLPDFANRMAGWLDDNVYVIVEDEPAPATYDSVVARQKQPFPLAFHVEFGAYLNTIRSSLDLLACALAKRNNIPRLDDIYFPVAWSHAAFIDPKFKGKKFIDALSQTERAIIQSLQPYKGGNDRLWLLHQLDIKRKHQRLLEIIMWPTGFTVPANFPSHAFVADFNAWILSGNNKTVLGTFKKGTPRNWSTDDLKVTQSIAIHEPTLVQPVRVVEALDDLAGLAHSIITLFDF
jgi:hypothetical protein